jgi:hypothetical protein
LSVIPAYNVEKCEYNDIPWSSCFENKLIKSSLSVNDWVIYYTNFSKPVWNTVVVSNKTFKTDSTCKEKLLEGNLDAKQSG